MALVALPALAIGSIAATTAGEPPALINRDPGPDDTDVPVTSAVALELVDPGPDGVAVSATKVWVNGELAFDGVVTASYAGPRASVTETADTLRVVLDPRSPFASLARVVVRVVSAIKGSTIRVDQTYAFSAEDRTAPRLVAGVATGQRTLRIAFDEPVVVPGPASLELRPLSAPAVPVSATSSIVSGSVVEVTVEPELTPDARYELRAIDVVDLRGNIVQPPFDRLELLGFRPARPATRRFDLWSMLPKHNRRSDVTGDLARFIACLQEITDLLLVEVDRFPDLFDVERAPEPFLDLILRDLGNPFPFDLDTLAKRRLASVLVDMYREKGTAIGVKNAVRFLLGVEIVAITGLAETALVLGESELGIDWELGPSDRFARYAFSIQVARVLSATERKRLRAVVEYLKPGHTHFVDLVEPLPSVVPDHWEIGLSDLGETALLH